ncbi:MarR family transcriptional regulator [Geodermatophilus normandii]|uniref:MarR family transcriptional regulator n=1 Tax=Geodermatophilus normandii TaxID=1137989 RepID=UPI001952D1AD
MPTSRDLPSDRPAIGQLLVKLLGEFRKELSAAGEDRGYDDLREPHMHVFGNVGIDGIRLTELAARAQLGLATMSELVTELERSGYLERRPDPADGRARLIYPTSRGRQLLDDAGDRVAEIEQHWAAVVGREEFEHTCRVLAQLLGTLTLAERGAKPGGDPTG